MGINGFYPGCCICYTQDYCLPLTTIVSHSKIDSATEKYYLNIMKFFEFQRVCLCVLYWVLSLVVNITRRIAYIVRLAIRSVPDKASETGPTKDRK